MIRRCCSVFSQSCLASDQAFVNDLPEEIIQDSEDPSNFFSAAMTDCERTVLIKFAAHRT